MTRAIGDGASRSPDHGRCRRRRRSDCPSSRYGLASGRVLLFIDLFRQFAEGLCSRLALPLYLLALPLYLSLQDGPKVLRLASAAFIDWNERGVDRFVRQVVLNPGVPA